MLRSGHCLGNDAGATAIYFNFVSEDSSGASKTHPFQFTEFLIEEIVSECRSFELQKQKHIQLIFEGFWGVDSGDSTVFSITFFPVLIDPLCV